jgi:hypothetical protein
MVGYSAGRLSFLRRFDVYEDRIFCEWDWYGQAGFDQGANQSAISLIYIIFRSQQYESGCRANQTGFVLETTSEGDFTRSWISRNLSTVAENKRIV